MQFLIIFLIELSNKVISKFPSLPIVILCHLCRQSKSAKVRSERILSLISFLIRFNKPIICSQFSPTKISIAVIAVVDLRFFFISSSFPLSL
jgi:hypothetical protein